MKTLYDLQFLIVDDEIEIREIMESYFQNRKLQVTTSNDGNEAIELYLKTPFDVIVTDIMMPGKNADGVTLIKNIRKQFNELTPVIIAMTGHSNETELEILNAGADNVLYKPFKFEELFSLIIKKFPE